MNRGEFSNNGSTYGQHNQWIDDPTDPEFEKQKAALGALFDLLGVTDLRLRDSVGLQQLLFKGHDTEMTGHGYDDVPALRCIGLPMINPEMLSMLHHLAENFDRTLMNDTTNPLDDRNKNRLERIKDAGGIEEIQVSATVDRPDMNKPGEQNPSVNDQGFVPEPSIAFIMKKQDSLFDGSSVQYAYKISRVGDTDPGVLAYEIFAIGTASEKSADSTKTTPRVVERLTCYFDDADGHQITERDNPEQPLIQSDRAYIPEMDVADLVRKDDVFAERVEQTRTETARTMVPYLSNYGKGDKIFVS